MADRGPGFSPEDLEKIFEMYYRGTQGQDNRLRSGAVHLPGHRGGPRRTDLGAEPDGGGAAVRFTLPLELQKDKVTVGTPSSKIFSGFSPGRKAMSRTDWLVLIIEDEVPIRRFLKAALEGQGFKWLEAATGHQGLAMAASHNPDIILLDLGLPDMDGLEVIRGIRDWARTPIIIISARGRDADKVDALDAGADDYLTKPFSVEELAARLRVAIRHLTPIPRGQG